jgi:Peptidase family M1 domain
MEPTLHAPARRRGTDGGGPCRARSGLGDPFFPLAGNGGYDVSNYSLRVSGVAVDGRAASFSRDGQELVITPQVRLRAGQSFTVVVNYAGVPEDNPRDKATYDFEVTVPAGLTVMANGVLVSQTSAGGTSTFVWREGLPMAPYLATATLGRFGVTQYRLASGLPVNIAVDPTLSEASVLKKLPDMVEFYTSIFGPYPFDAAGAIVDNAKQVGYSLEMQTKPVFYKVPDEATLAHELSHMWYGDSVTLTLWPDIWLHEGFATWSEWIWSEHVGQKSAHQYFNTVYNTPARDTVFWTPPPGNPGTPVFLFKRHNLQPRRDDIAGAAGEGGRPGVFFRIMRGWATQNQYGNVTTPQFIALAERESGMDLAHFLDVWLCQPPSRHPGDLTPRRADSNQSESAPGVGQGHVKFALCDQPWLWVTMGGVFAQHAGSVRSGGGLMFPRTACRRRRLLKITENDTSVAPRARKGVA